MKLNVRIALVFTSSAASTEDGWLVSFFIVNLLFYFDTLFLSVW